MDKITAEQAIILLCKASRKAQRKTLTYVANRTGWHYSTLSKFEHGRFNRLIAEAYYREVLNEPERVTFDNLKEDI